MKSAYNIKRQLSEGNICSDSVNVNNNSKNHDIVEGVLNIILITSTVCIIYHFPYSHNQEFQ